VNSINTIKINRGALIYYGEEAGVAVNTKINQVYVDASSQERRDKS
jgi:hypothetical protein